MYTTECRITHKMRYFRREGRLKLLGFATLLDDVDRKFFNSPLADGRGSPSGTPYDPLDFSDATADPDQIRALAAYRNQLYVIGSETTEVFRNIGRSPSPFQRISGAVIDVGVNQIIKPFDLFAKVRLVVSVGVQIGPFIVG